RHLIKQGLEQVVVLAVDQRDAHRRPFQRAGCPEPAESSTDDDNLGHRVVHARPGRTHPQIVMHTLLSRTVEKHGVEDRKHHEENGLFDPIPRLVYALPAMPESMNNYDKNHREETCCTSLGSGCHPPVSHLTPRFLSLSRREIAEV